MLDEPADRAKPEPVVDRLALLGGPGPGVVAREPGRGHDLTGPLVQSAGGAG
ncbi:MAG TPA: hypothetical protein VI011_16255 [Asanoa sp.]